MVTTVQNGIYGHLGLDGFGWRGWGLGLRGPSVSGLGVGSFRAI